MADNKDEYEKMNETITDQQREIAQNALNEFNKPNYNISLQNINKIDGRLNDFKVAHNKAIVEYYKNDLKKIEQFQKALSNVFVQFQLSLEKLDDVDHCILHFNQAILLYHQQQYTAALRIMDRVHKFIEPMDEGLGKCVGLLMTELQLCIKQPEKGLSLLSYLQNQLLNGNGNNTKLIKVKGNEKEQKEKKVQPLNAASELFLRKLCKYRLRCYLMMHSIELAKNELQLENNAMPDVVFMKANLEYLQGNHQESIKILTSIPKDAFCYDECGEDSTILFYNNIGVVHYAMGKPNLACHYFQSALKEDMSRISGRDEPISDKPLYKLGSTKYHEIVYNLGLALLRANKPVQAFECLIIAVRRFHRNSRLWLRLAECCIMAHKQSNEVDFDLLKKQKEMVVECVGSKEMQKVILTTNMSKDKKYENTDTSYAVPLPTLEFASLCLRNAYLLLPSDTTSSPVPLLLIPGVTPPAPPPSPGPAPSNPLSAHEISKLRNAILIASAYVSLCLGDYILALEYARNALSQPKLSEGHRLLANLYAAESLVLLDKISDALDYLNPENVKDISFDLSDETDDVEETKEENKIKTEPPLKWFPTTVSCAVAVMQYNIAVAKTISGQLDQAGSLLSQIWQSRRPDCKVPAHILMLVLYIELKLGHADIARSLIKQYSFQQKVTRSFPK